MNTRWAAALTLAIVAPACVPAWADYKLGPDSKKQPGVPEGKVTQYKFKSTIFPGTVRDAWTYVPAQYDAKEPACVMVFQDGGGYVNVGDKAQFKVPIVFDNLIHNKEMPVTIGIFLNPGVVPASSKDKKPRQNRSFEYDTLSDQYARFLEKEILPEVGKSYNCARTPRDGPSPASAPAAFVPSPSPGSDRTCSVRSYRTSAASPTFAAATSIPA
jgi:hypothetical protein